MLRWLASCAIVLTAAVSSAQTPLGSDDQLLQALSGQDWQQRRRAVHEIIQLGPDADSRVAGLLKRNLDQEQRKNVELALRMIRDQRLFGGSLISLHVKSAPAADVIKSIESQCGGGLPTSPSDLLKQSTLPRLTLDFDRKPFWDVLQEISSKLEIDYLLSDPQEVRLTRSGSRHGEMTSTSGAFLFTSSAYGMRRGMSLDLAVYAEPKVLVLRMMDLKLERAVDDQGNVLTPQSGRGFRGRAGFGRFNSGRVRSGPRQVSSTFQRPPGDRIAELRGQVKLSVQDSSTRWEVGDLLDISRVTRTVDAIPISLETVKLLSPETYQLQISIPYGWENSTNSTQQEEVIDLIGRGLSVVDAAGRRLSMDTPDARQQSNTTEIDVDFSRTTPGPRTGPPTKLIWTIPDQTRQIFVPFDFKNIVIDDPFN